MTRIDIKKGLDLPIAGEPQQVISPGNNPHSVAVLGNDYVGMKPKLEVAVGDQVKRGQLLFTDRHRPAIRYTSPGAGTIAAINRGDKRVLLSVVISLSGNDEVQFDPYPEGKLKALDRKSVVELLLSSGLWTSLRTRPFSTVADPEGNPHSLFVTAMDTNPLAPSMARIIEGKEHHFVNGLTVLSRLTDGTLYLCTAPGDTLPQPPLSSLTAAAFSGPHPAGNPGTHIHFLDPVDRHKTAWYINAQDVIAMGLLFTTGRLNVERIVSLAGPSVKNPRLLKTRIGASLDDMTSGELTEGENRILSGSVFSGHIAHEATAFLGRYHQQITVLPEGRKRSFLGWLSAGFSLFSVKPIVAASFLPKRKLMFTTALQGGERAIVPIGSYEKVMPLDILPTHLLRALAVDDVEEAERLGCLELDEEDLALCTFVCPSKLDHGVELRRNLTLLEKEG
ncbi:MAG TPA: NADH:ubiquinone reductase (Na(+)-transporting) subunit A [Nitrospiraceae bacterium]|nr:NADH:ubiquinone reductase (Na(+)-transporting) subunit A [Nitrospiraceae bacterium]